MRLIHLLMVLLVAAAGATPGSAATPNLVLNGGFEEMTGAAPAGWQTSGAPAIKQTLTSDAGRAGGRSARLTCTHFEGDTPYSHVMVCQVGAVEVTKGKWYRLSLWAKSEGRGPRDCGAALSETQTWQSSGLSEALVPGADWKRFEFLFQAARDVPAKASRLQFWFRGEGTLWLDDVELVETEVKEAWQPEIPTAGFRNFIPNSSFECGAAGWGGFSPSSGFWAAKLCELVGTVDATAAAHGRRSLKIHLDPKDLPRLYFDYYDPYDEPVRTVLAANEGWFAVEPGKPYVLSASVKADRAGTVAVLAAVQAGAGSQSKKFSSGTDWQRVSFSFRPRTRFIHVAAGLELAADKTEAATLWLDALQLEAGEKPVDYQPRAPVEAFIGTAVTGGIFTAPEKGIDFFLTASNDTVRPAQLKGAIELTDFFGKEVAREAVALDLPPGGAERSWRAWAAGRQGFFRLTWKSADRVQNVRCALIVPFDGADSRIGMNHAYSARFLLDLAREGGILWWRDWSVKWNTVEPKQGEFDFRATDVQVDRVLKAGGKVLLLFPFPSADWSTSADPKVVAAEAGGNDYLRRRLPAAFAAKKLDDFERYVQESVRHYRDRVTYYQVLNEALYTTYALPARFGYQMKDYVAHVEAAYRAVKKEQAGALVVGGIGCSPADKRAAAFIEAGGLRFADILDVHMYSPAGMLDVTEDALKALRRQMEARKEVRPIWVTEFGLYADDEPARVPQRVGDQTMQRCSRATEADAASDLVKLVAMFGACGVDKVFLHAGTTAAINEPSAGGVFVAYGGAPRKIYCAAAVLTRMLPPKAEFLKADALGAGLRSYTFKTSAGEVTVAWCDGEAARAFRPRPGLAAFDIMGNRLTGDEISIGSSPVYLVARTLRIGEGK